MAATGVPGLGDAQNLGINMIQNQGMTPGLNQLATKFGGLGDAYSQQQNPYLQAAIEAAQRQTQDRVNSSMSAAGRYGSAQYADGSDRAGAEVADPILAQDYAQRQQQ